MRSANWNDIELAQMVPPSLTTARIPRDLIGRRIFESLVGSETEPECPRELVIEPAFIARESCGPPPADA